MSSTTSKRLLLELLCLRGISDAWIRVFSLASWSFSSRLTVNLLPLPSSLSTAMSPSIISTKFLTTVSPKPIPNTPLCVVLFSRLNGSNNCSLNFSEIPIPLSSTIKRYFLYPFISISVSAIVSVIVPSGFIYFAALSRSCIKTSLIRIKSAITAKCSTPVLSIRKRMDFFFMIGRTDFLISANSSPKLHSLSIRFTLPDSIRVTSSDSFKIDNSCSLEARILSK